MNHTAASLVRCLLALMLPGTTSAMLSIRGELDGGSHSVQVDSAVLGTQSFPTPDWHADSGEVDTFLFTGMSRPPLTATLYCVIDGTPDVQVFAPLVQDSWLVFQKVNPVEPKVRFSEQSAIGEGLVRPPAEHRFEVSPNIIVPGAAFRVRCRGAESLTLLDVSGVPAYHCRLAPYADGDYWLRWPQTGLYGRRLRAGTYACVVSVRGVHHVQRVVQAR